MQEQEARPVKPLTSPTSLTKSAGQLQLAQSLFTSNEEGTMNAFASACLQRVLRVFITFRHAFTYILSTTLFRQQPHASPPATMPRAKGTKAIVDLVGDAQKRAMVHVKTKEECRLGNETIDVWSVELPSKHAETILRLYVPCRHTIATH
jgi:hypothetical protein